MIKNKNDVIEIVRGLKEGNFLNYETDTNINSFSYNSETKRFIMDSQSKVLKIKGCGSVTYDVIVCQIWIDRKYINKLILR